MGFWDLKATCALCDREVGWNRFQIDNDIWACPACFIKYGGLELAKAALKEKRAGTEEIASFKPTKKIGVYIEFDNIRKQWLIPDGYMGKKKNPRIYNYNDIVDFEVLEDGETITEGGLGRAVAGGILFGGVGAIVGGVTGGKNGKTICNSLRLKITVKDINNPLVYVNFITVPTRRDSIAYKDIYNFVQECLSTLQLICKGQRTTENQERSNISKISAADEILKYKNLLDNGIITQEEFDAKKKQLLGL